MYNHSLNRFNPEKSFCHCTFHEKWKKACVEEDKNETEKYNNVQSLTRSQIQRVYGKRGSTIVRNDRRVVAATNQRVDTAYQREQRYGGFVEFASVCRRQIFGADALWVSPVLDSYVDVNNRCQPSVAVCARQLYPGQLLLTNRNAGHQSWWRQDACSGAARAFIRLLRAPTCGRIHAQRPFVQSLSSPTPSLVTNLDLHLIAQDISHFI